MCHGTEEGELTLFWLTRLFLEGCSHLEAPHYQIAGSSWREFTEDPQEWLRDWRADGWGKEYKWETITWLNQGRRNTQLYKYLKSINLTGGGIRLLWWDLVVGRINQGWNLSKGKGKLIIISKCLIVHFISWNILSWATLTCRPLANWMICVFYSTSLDLRSALLCVENAGD